MQNWLIFPLESELNSCKTKGRDGLRRGRSLTGKNDLENKQSQRIKSDLQLFLEKDFLILSLQLILKVHKNPDLMN